MACWPSQGLINITCKKSIRLIAECFFFGFIYWLLGLRLTVSGLVLGVGFFFFWPSGGCTGCKLGRKTGFNGGWGCLAGGCVTGGCVLGVFWLAAGCGCAGGEKFLDGLRSFCCAGCAGWLPGGLIAGWFWVLLLAGVGFTGSPGRVWCCWCWSGLAGCCWFWLLLFGLSCFGSQAAGRFHWGLAGWLLFEPLAPGWGWLPWLFLKP